MMAFGIKCLCAVTINSRSKPHKNVNKSQQAAFVAGEPGDARSVTHGSGRDGLTASTIVAPRRGRPCSGRCAPGRRRRGAFVHDAAGAHHHDAVGQLHQLVEVFADEEYGGAAVAHFEKTVVDELRPHRNRGRNRGWRQPARGFRGPPTRAPGSRAVHCRPTGYGSADPEAGGRTEKRSIRCMAARRNSAKFSSPAREYGGRSKSRSARFSATVMPGTAALRRGSSGRIKTPRRRMVSRVG